MMDKCGMPKKMPMDKGFYGHMKPPKMPKIKKMPMKMPRKRT